MPIGAKGDPDAFSTFYVDYFPRAVKTLKLIYPMIDIDTVYELVQDSMGCMYRAQQENIGKMKDSELRAYLMTAARRKAIDHMKNQGRYEQFDDEMAGRGYDNTADICDALQILADVQTLRPELREVVALRYADLTVPQIAKMTGVNQNTVKSRLRIARKYLEHWISADGNRKTQKGPTR
jgi:RNA polymerase sigma factor (sigma-70 family)